MWHMLECGTCASLAAHRYIRIILKNVNRGLWEIVPISPGRCAGKLCKIGVDSRASPQLRFASGCVQAKATGENMRNAHWTLAQDRAAGDIRAGRLAQTCLSPTGSGPEGSSPNEPDAGCCPASHRRASNVIASEAKQSRAIDAAFVSGSPRRQEPPRDDDSAGSRTRGVYSEGTTCLSGP